MMSNEEYVAKSKEISRALLQSVIDQRDDWKLVKDAGDDTKVYSKPSPDTKGNAYKVETTFDAPLAKVLSAVDPTKPYRVQWDEYLAELKVETKLIEGVYLIYHGTKAMLGGLVSARDSLDVVTVAKDGDNYYVAAGTVDHVNYPPRDHSVRIHQYYAGYVIFPIPDAPNKCRFVMVMNTDMRMSTVGNFFSEPVKPRLLLEKIKNLRRGLATLEIKYDDIQ